MRPRRTGEPARPSVIGAILPDGVVAVEAFDDHLPAVLHPAEEVVVARAVPKRRREFATGRRCAKEALAALGHPQVALLPGEAGAPVWPPGVVGSITHCRGYRAAAVSTTDNLAALGIDAEPNEPMPTGVLATVARPEELARVAALLKMNVGLRWDRLLFCAKEAAYKAWFTRTREQIGAMRLPITLHPADGRFTAGPGLHGRYLSADGLLITAVAVPV